MSAENPGARLKKLRLEKGLTLDEVHKKTKIHLNILKAIEEDNLLNVNPVYIKGFLKIYSKFLGADPKDFIAGYKETRSSSQIKPKQEMKPPSFLKSASVKLKGFKPRINLKSVFLVAGIIIAAIVLFNIAKGVAARVKHSHAKEKISATLTSFEKNVNKKESPKQKKFQAQSVVPVSSVIRLGIRAKENCYINLKGDGRALFQGVLKKGRFESWQAKEKFELALGNAGVVDLEINGKLITNLGKRGRALKGILINKQGLSIGQ